MNYSYKFPIIIKNFRSKRRLKRCLNFISFFILFIILLYYNLNILPLAQKKNSISEIILKSNCECRKDVLFINKNVKSYNIRSNLGGKSYSIDQESLFTCDLFNTFRRGPNQKVISFSLFGKELLYYDYLDNIIESAKHLYPDWTIRVYHDDSIDQSIICKKQCLKNENNKYYDNIDFCNINQVPYDLTYTWNANYMLPMAWRWLPLGDDFVDVFISRDLDSCLLDREVDAVNEWLSSNNLFHIMRDHPSHKVRILGGMWGYYNERNRKLAKYFYEVVSSKFKSFYYRTYLSKRQPDQYMLGDYFWPLAKKNSTSHDSFYCKTLGGKPFPSKRPDYFCHVGFIGCCNPKENKTFFECPIECRPKDHQHDWFYC